MAKTEQTHTRQIRLAVTLWCASVLFAGASFVYIFVNPSAADVVWGFRGFQGFAGLLETTTALIIILNQPRNPAGWIFMIAGFPSCVLSFAEEYALWGWINYNGEVPLFWLTAWLPNWLWAFGNYLPIFQFALYFPNGKLPSPAWRPVLLWGSAIMVLLFAFYAILPGDFYGEPLPQPLGLNFSLALNIRLGIVITSVPAFFSISAIGLYTKFRKGSYLLRQQLKWFILTAAIFPLSTIVGGFEGGWSDLALGALLIVFFASIAISIVRFRLFDIDIIIRRTLVYALLTAILASVYFGSVVTLQSVVSTLGGEQSAFVTVVSTLAIAALFTPLRRRVQDFIDRRFFRTKYDAEQTLAAFANTARDEVDMERLAGALLRVVEDTMQPTTANLWLQPMDTPRRESQK